MTTILKPENFVGEIFIPSSLDCDNPHIRNSIQYFIDRYEKKGLVCMLGAKGYDDLIQGWQASTIDAKFINLVEGNTYVKDDATYYFEGLRAIIARYVYYYYKQNEVTETSERGEGQAINAYQSHKSVVYKQVNNWNEMVNLIGFKEDCNCECKEPCKESTLRDYLKYSEEFEDYIVSDFEYINRLGI